MNSVNSYNGVNSFTMYFDFYNLIDSLPSVKDKAILLIAINDYIFKDIEPKLSRHNQAIFNTLKKQLNSSKCQSKRGSKTKTKKETDINPEDIPEENKTSILSFKFYIYNFKFINNNEILISKIEQWLNYKKQRKDKPYTEIGLNALLKKIDKAVEEYGTEKTIDVIDYSIANNYQGIVFDRLIIAKPNSNKSNNQSWEEVKRRALENDKNGSN